MSFVVLVLVGNVVGVVVVVDVLEELVVVASGVLVEVVLVVGSAHKRSVVAVGPATSTSVARQLLMMAQRRSLVAVGCTASNWSGPEHTSSATH